MEILVSEIIEGKHQVWMAIGNAVAKGNSQLDARINDLRHLMNDQLIQLKYGKDYQASHDDEILIQAKGIFTERYS